MNESELPDPLRTFLTIEINAMVGLQTDAIHELKDAKGTEWWTVLRSQLNDPQIIDKISDPKVFEKLTDIGFEDEASVRTWLRHIWNYVYTDGPYPHIP